MHFGSDRGIEIYSVDQAIRHTEMVGLYLRDQDNQRTELIARISTLKREHNQNLADTQDKHRELMEAQQVAHARQIEALNSQPLQESLEQAQQEIRNLNRRIEELKTTIHVRDDQIATLRRAVGVIKNAVAIH